MKTSHIFFGLFLIIVLMTGFVDYVILNQSAMERLINMSVNWFTIMMLHAPSIFLFLIWLYLWHCESVEEDEGFIRRMYHDEPTLDNR